ncbi:MAG TPA: hypothetical protein PK393_07120 [Synergistaceae bacterium]|nr:hypothetical protein [Synergistaceae bacterium]
MWKEHPWGTLVLLALAGAMGFLARFEPPLLRQGDRLWQDYHMATRLLSEPSHPIILLSLKEAPGGSFDAPAVLPEILGLLREARAVVIPPGVELRLDASGDQKIAEAARRAGNVVGGVALGGGGGPGGWVRFAAVTGVELQEPDSDGRYRSFSPFASVEGKMVPSLPLAAYLHVTRDVPRIKESPSGLRVLALGDRRLPLDFQGRLPVAIPPEGAGPSSFVVRSKDLSLPEDTLRRAIVVLELPSRQRRTMPLPAFSPEAHASAGNFLAWSIGTLFVPALPQSAPWIWPAALAWGGMALAVALVWWMPLGAVWAGVLGVLVLVVGCAALVFSATLICLSPLVPLLGVLTAGSVAVGLRWIRHRRERALAILAGDAVRSFLEGLPADDATFEECLRKLWPDLERLTGVRLLGAFLPQGIIEEETLDGGTVLARSPHLYLVRNDVDPPRYRLYARQDFSLAEGEPRFVALGWERLMPPETLRSLALMLSLSSWFYAGTRASERRLFHFRQALGGVLRKKSRNAPTPLVAVVDELARQLGWHDSRREDLHTLAVLEGGLTPHPDAPPEVEAPSAVGFLKSSEGNPLEAVLEAARAVVREMPSAGSSPGALRDRVRGALRGPERAALSSELLAALEEMDYRAVLTPRDPLPPSGA